MCEVIIVPRDSDNDNVTYQCQCHMVVSCIQFNPYI